MVHIYNPNAFETETGGSLQVLASMGYIETVSKKEKNLWANPGIICLKVFLWFCFVVKTKNHWSKTGLFKKKKKDWGAHQWRLVWVGQRNPSAGGLPVVLCGAGDWARGLCTEPRSFVSFLFYFWDSLSELLSCSGRTKLWVPPASAC